MRSLFARVGMAVVPGLRAATIPACAVCAAAPVLAGPVSAIGLSAAAAFLHNMLWLLLPLNLILLWRSYGRHGDATGLVLATVGVVLILAHLATHVLGIPREMSEMIATTDDVTINDIAQLGSTVIVEVIAIMAAIWVGAVLLIAGSLIDWRAQRRMFFRRRRAYAV